jgi:hypothetical protein
MLDSCFRGNDIERSGNDKSPLFISVLEFLGNTNLLPLKTLYLQGFQTPFRNALLTHVERLLKGINFRKLAITTPIFVFLKSGNPYK